MSTRSERGETIGSIGLVAFGYLIGALPFCVALASAHRLDPTAETDIHVAIRRHVGWIQAAIAVAVDITKGVFPVLLGFGLSLSVRVVSFAAVAAVVGQMWPPLRGHGEKGDSTGVGALIALLMVNGAYVALLSLAFFALGAVLRFGMMNSRSPERQSPDHPLSLALPVGMLLGFAVAPMLSWGSGQPAGVMIGLLLVLCAIVVKRLTAGLRADLSVGAPMGPVLVRRLVFDQPLIGRG